MFESVLVANRGEIACRVISTLKKHHIRAIAIYSAADAHARHVKMADEAYLVGPAPVAESYLNQGRILEIAKASNASAIHPGYGFLSENTSFAKACETANITFIGPSPEAMSQMASKSVAKNLMAKAGVPLLPGYQGDDQSLNTLTKKAQSIGFPVLIKAAHGGGGKGMRIVEAKKELKEAITLAQQEAQNNFGDATLLLEKYCPTARHIEVQIMGDHTGEVRHFYERECSLQRRYQKIIEEAPALRIPEAVKTKLYETAINAAKAINYTNAGTIEFLMTPDNQFYFMEMNTRLQVEHPVTECITGFDLVAWQCRVAAGEAFDFKQDEVPCNGHAIEARVYAEDPNQDFMPATGTIHHLFFPKQRDGLRIDNGIKTGDTVGVYYDPMLMKCITWGQTRAEACQRLTTALSDMGCAGLTTNLAFVQQLSTWAPFQDGVYDTSSLKTFTPSPTDETLQPFLHIAASYALQHRTAVWPLNYPASTWTHLAGWQCIPAIQQLQLKQAGQQHHITYQMWGKQLRLAEGDAWVNVTLTPEYEDVYAVCLGEHTYTARLYHHDTHIALLVAGQCLAIDVNQSFQAEQDAMHDSCVTAPMPALVTAVFVQAGQAVQAGDKLLTLEAMKMAHTLTAPFDGKIAKVCFAINTQVDEGANLVEFETDA